PYHDDAMRLSVHLTFRGECAAAFRLYERVLGGRDLRTFRWGDTLGAYELMGADVAADHYERPRGFYVYHAVDAHADAERIFAALADRGEVLMPLQQTFWAPVFGVVVDRYGVPWEI